MKLYRLALLFIFATTSWATSEMKQKTPADIAAEKSMQGDDDGRRSFAPKIPDKSADSLDELSSLEDVTMLAKVSKTDIGEQKTVKLVFERANNKIHFMNTNKYSYHFDYVTRVLKWAGTSTQFNVNYRGDGSKREFNQASLIVSPRKLKNNKQELLLEIWNGDSLSGVYLKELFDKVSKKINLEKFEIIFHPISDLHLANVKETGIPFVENSDLYDGKDYWPLSRHDAIGYVRIIDEITEESLKALEPSDIVVFLKSIPNEIGFVSGIVTKEFQTPLSHINIKSKNRGTLNISMVKAKEFFSEYEGKAVRLKAGVEKPEIEDLSHLSKGEIAKEIGAFWKGKRPKLKEEIAVVNIKSVPNGYVNLSEYYPKNERLPNRSMHSGLIGLVGAKAANLALLNHLSVDLKKTFKVEVPRSIGLPFTYYQKFIEQPIVLSEATRPAVDAKFLKHYPLNKPIELRVYIKNILEHTGLLNTETLKTRKEVEWVLEDIRSKYLEVTIPEEIFALFKKAIFEDETSPIHISKEIPRIRLRSSTNSEDLEGFTGAGLYESAGINLYKKLKSKKGYNLDKPKKWKKIKKSLIEKLPALYAGVWNTRAFMEREWFGLNGDQHLRVNCALAIHQAFPFYTFGGVEYERANGVAATRNIYAADKHEDSGIDELYINGQHWDLAVTNPPTKEELIERGANLEVPYRTEETLVTAFANDPDKAGRADEYKWWFGQNLKKSSVNDSKPVLIEDAKSNDDYSKMESRRVVGAFQYLRDKMSRVYQRDFSRFHIEGEWKVLGEDRVIMIKQMREFAKVGQ